MIEVYIKNLWETDRVSFPKGFFLKTATVFSKQDNFSCLFAEKYLLSHAHIVLVYR
jgi:hypothetical protein